MNLTELAELIEDYDGYTCVDPNQIKGIISRIGTINWSEFLTLQTLNTFSPEKLLTTKFVNFVDVADPEAKCNKPILNDCILTTQQFAKGTFSQFKSNDVSWGFCFFLLSYLQDVQENLSTEAVIELRASHEKLHEELIESINNYDEYTMDAVAFLTSIDPELTKSLMEELL